MQNKLSIQQKQLIDTLRQNNPDLRTYSDEEILSVLNNSSSEIKMSEDETISILSAIAGGNELSGLNLEKTAPQTLTLPKEQESQLISVLKQRINSVTQKTKEAESKNGFLGKAWNWTKNNLLDWCTDSTNDIKKAQEEELKLLDNGNIKDTFTQITGLEFNQDNLNKFLNNEIHTKSEQALEGYKEGQEMAADFAGDMISGIAAVGIYMVAVGAAPFSGGASLGLIALGTAVAGTGAGLIKSGLKYADAKSAGQEYNTFGKDMITGSFSGILAPFTGGVGGAVGRNVATKLGVEVVKQVGKETVKQTGKQTLKTILTNPTGYEYLGGTLAKRALSLGSEMAVDGALGGAIDGTFREGVEEINKDGSLDIGKLGSAFLQGGIGGFVATPAIGGGLKGVGKVTGRFIGKNVDNGAVNSVSKNTNEIGKTTNNSVSKNTPDANIAVNPKETADTQPKVKKLRPLTTEDRANIERLKGAVTKSHILNNSNFRALSDIIREFPQKADNIIKAMETSSGGYNTFMYIINHYSENIGSKQADLLLDLVSLTEISSITIEKGFIDKVLNTKPEKIETITNLLKSVKKEDYYPLHYHCEKLFDINQFEDTQSIIRIFNSEKMSSYELGSEGMFKYVEKIIKSKPEIRNHIVSFLDGLERDFYSPQKIAELTDLDTNNLQFIKNLSQIKNGELFSGYRIFDEIVPALKEKHFDEKTLNQLYEIFSNDSDFSYITREFLEFSSDKIDSLHFLTKIKNSEGQNVFRGFKIREYSKYEPEYLNCIKELTKILKHDKEEIHLYDNIGQLDKSNLQAVIDIAKSKSLTNYEISLLTDQDPSYINLIAQRFLENPSGGRNYLEELIEKPKSLLQDPNYKLTAEEQELETAFLNYARSLDGLTKYRKACSNLDDKLDKNAVTILKDLLKHNYYQDDAFNILNTLKKADGSFDIEKYNKVSQILNTAYSRNYALSGNAYSITPAIFKLASDLKMDELPTVSNILMELGNHPTSINKFLEIGIKDKNELLNSLNKYIQFLDSNPDHASILEKLPSGALDKDLAVLDLITSVEKFAKSKYFDMEYFVKELKTPPTKLQMEIITTLQKNFEGKSISITEMDIINLMKNVDEEKMPLFRFLTSEFNGTKEVSNGYSTIDADKTILSAHNINNIIESANSKENLDLITYFIKNDIVSYTLYDESTFNIDIGFCLERAHKRPETTRFLKEFNHPYAKDILKKFDKNLDDFIKSLNSEDRKFVAQLSSIKDERGEENFSDIILQLSKRKQEIQSLTKEQREMCLTLAPSVLKNSLFHEDEIYKNLFSLSKNIKPEDIAKTLSLIQKLDISEYHLLPEIINAQKTFNKEAYDKLFKMLGDLDAPLDTEAIRNIVTAPYNKENFNYIVESFGKDDVFSSNSIANYLSNGGTIKNLEFMKNSNHDLINLLKASPNVLALQPKQVLIVLNEMLREIQQFGEPKYSVIILDNVRNLDLNTIDKDLLTKLYKLYDEDGNHIIPENEFINIVSKPEVAGKLLNESTSSIPPVNLNNIKITPDNIESFVQNLDNIYKVLLLDEHGKMSEASYKSLLEKLNSNQFLRDALVDFEKTGKIQLDKISDPDVAIALLAPSDKLFAVMKLAPELIDTNPALIKQYYNDLVEIFEESYKLFKTFLDANPGAIPQGLSIDGFIKLIKDASFNEQELKEFYNCYKLVGKDRLINYIHNADIKQDPFSLFDKLTKISETPFAEYMQKVFALDNLTESDFNTILRTTDFVLYDSTNSSVKISEAEFADILNKIAQKNEFDKNEFLYDIYQGFLNSNTKGFQEMNRQQLNIVAKYDLINNKNIDPQEWIDFTNLPEKLYPAILEITKTQKLSSVIDLLNITEDEIKNLEFGQKVKLVSIINELTPEHIEIMDNCGFKIKNIINEISKTLEVEKRFIPTSKANQTRFFKNIIANNNPKAEKFLKETDFTTETFSEGIPLKYSRKEFSSDIDELLSTVSKEDMITLWKHFGIEKGADGYDGIPVIPTTSSTLPSKLQDVANKIAEKIKKFTLENETTIEDKNMKEFLDSLIQGFPEFTSIIGKEQHGTHKYTLDIHILKVLQQAMNDPDYAKLSDESKTLLKLATLVHDFGKKGGIVDKGHAELSAVYMNGILAKFKLSESDKFRIIDLVNNHHWFELYNTGKMSSEEMASLCRNPQDFEISKLMAKGDLMSVNEDFHFSRTNTHSLEELNDYFAQKFSYIEEKIRIINQKANLVFDTKILNRGKNFPTQSMNVKGVTENFRVLNLTDQSLGDLAQYGFPPGTTIDNLRFITHMPSNKVSDLYAKMKVFNFLTETSQIPSVQSTSLTMLKDSRSYGGRNFGFILNVDQANISAAHYENISSGYHKGMEHFKELLFDRKAQPFVKTQFITHSKTFGYEIDNNIYERISTFLYNKQHLSSIFNDKMAESKTYVFKPDGSVSIETSINPTVLDGEFRIKAKDLRQILELSRDDLTRGQTHSEIVPLNPRISALIAKVDKLEDCPEPFLQFAKEYDLPIVLVGKK